VTDSSTFYADDVNWNESPTTLTPEGRSGGLDMARQAVSFGA
jgi:hypothetical protein